MSDETLVSLAPYPNSILIPGESSISNSGPNSESSSGPNSESISILNEISNREAPQVLSDNELIGKIKNLACAERRLTKILIIHIAEFDQRKLYLKQAYGSLFEYLTNEIGYSDGAAQRRIDAARLSVSAPDIATKIENGSINLSQISYLQRACRQIKKDSGFFVPNSFRADIINSLENKNKAQSEVIVAQALQLPVLVSENVAKHQADRSVRIEMTFTEKEMESITQARHILSNKTGGTMKDTFVEMANSLVKANQIKINQNENENKLKLGEAEVSTATVAAGRAVGISTAIVAVPTKIRKTVLARDGSCQFKNKVTGKVCGSKFFLEADHIQPRFAGGSNALENLRMLCRKHNQYRYSANL